jgi:hypothetical protein
MMNGARLAQPQHVRIPAALGNSLIIQTSLPLRLRTAALRTSAFTPFTIPATIAESISPDYSAVKRFRKILVRDLDDFFLGLGFGNQLVQPFLVGRAVHWHLDGLINQRGVENHVGQFD